MEDKPTVGEAILFNKENAVIITEWLYTNLFNRSIYLIEINYEEKWIGYKEIDVGGWDNWNEIRKLIEVLPAGHKHKWRISSTAFMNKWDVFKRFIVAHERKRKISFI
jgi:hypothetical protein